MTSNVSSTRAFTNPQPPAPLSGECVSHFAALAARTEDGWHSTEVELEGLADIDEVAEVMRDASVDDGPVLLFVEEDDEWFAIVRVDGVGEPRTFISDARVVPGSELAALVYRGRASRGRFRGARLGTR